MSARLSIIVTLYNKAQYIFKCLESCLNQTVSNDYEVIVVNDGSTDNSLEIVNSYLLGHPFIKIVDQANQGLSVSRNNGVKTADGDYIWFVDADDWISPYSVSLILSAIDNEPDVIPIYAQNYGESVVRNRIDVSAKTGRDVMLGGKWNHCGPFYIYRRQFLIDNDLHYMPGIYHEDSELTPRLLSYAQSVVVIPEVLYTVYRDPHSITQVPKLKRAFDNLLVASRLYDFKEEKIVGDVQLEKVFDYNVAQLFNNGLAMVCNFSIEDQTLFSKKAYEFKRIYASCRNSSFKYRVEGILLFFFPKQCVSVYKFLKLFC